MCTRCYQRERKAGRLEIVKTKWFNPDGTRMTCSREGCEKPVHLKGLCSPHYQKSIAPPLKGRVYETKWFNPDGTRMTCRVDDCDKRVSAASLCSMHYNRLHRYGTTDLLEKEWPVCPVPDCGRTMTGKSAMCGKCRQARWRYGLSDETYMLLMQPENRFCGNPGCGSTERLHIDHDHSCCPYGKFPTKTRVSCGKCVRGWLCHSCNVTLGQMQESPERIRGLLTYLERFS